MFETKNLFSAIAIALTFAGYFPYIKSIIKKQTKPHFYSWLVWTLDGLIIFGLQLTNGAGSGSFVVLSATLLSAFVLFLTIRDKNRKKPSRSDTVFLVLALAALGLWLFAKQPLLSAILIMTVDVLGFIPTIRKSWINPHSENISFYIINTVRFVFAFFALKEYSVVNLLYPLVWFINNAGFVGMLVLRKKVVPNKAH
jgi:hypothetical protein